MSESRSTQSRQDWIHKHTECHPDPRETPRRLKFVSNDGRVCFSLFKVIILV